MEMTSEIKYEAEKLAGLFLDTMPDDSFERYEKQNLHHQLAYFYSWCKVMENEFGQVS